ncbi:MAG TPA: recombinase zinc beta ribbon domain-containing protein, partial [Anaerolineae bacterium]|nr:recombinase zinc beta ribbon domain-containing protein [Anaerolineae bacterium]
WNKRTVCRILKRETYTGIWYFGKSGSSEPIPVRVPAIISQEVWEAAQEKLEENQEKSRRNMKYKYLLSGHLTCGICGYRMSGISKKHKDKRYFYYRCPANEYVDSTRKCTLPHFTAYEVEASVWGWIKSILTSPEQLAEGLKQYQDQQAQITGPLQERLKIVDDLLAENQTQLQRLLDLYLKGDFPQEMLTERKDRLETTIKNLKDERARLSAHLEAKMLTEEQIRTVKDFAEKVRDGLTAADNNFESQRQIVEMLDIQITLTIENNKKIAYVQCRLGQERLPIRTLASYEKFWYNGLKLIPLFISVNFCT